jgi:hypothetical protein
VFLAELAGLLQLDAVDAGEDRLMADGVGLGSGFVSDLLAQGLCAIVMLPTSEQFQIIEYVTLGCLTDCDPIYYRK